MKFKKILLLLLLSIVLISCSKKLTNEKLDEIVSSKDINELTWDDFKKFQYQEDNSNSLTRIYTLEDGSSLILTGEDETEIEKISIVDIEGNSVYLKN